MDRTIAGIPFSDRPSSKTLVFRESEGKLKVLFNPNDDGQYGLREAEDPALCVTKLAVANPLALAQLPSVGKEPAVATELATIYRTAAQDLLFGLNHRLELYQYDPEVLYRSGLVLMDKAGEKHQEEYPRILSGMRQLGLPYFKYNVGKLIPSRFLANGDVAAGPPADIEIQDPAAFKQIAMALATGRTDKLGKDESELLKTFTSLALSAAIPSIPCRPKAGVVPRLALPTTAKTAGAMGIVGQAGPGIAMSLGRDTVDELKKLAAQLGVSVPAEPKSLVTEMDF